MLANDIMEINIDPPKDPRENHNIHLSLGWDSEGHHVDKEMVV